MNDYVVDNIIKNNQKSEWRIPVYNITGDALKFVQDFIKYAELDPEAMADIMYYDYDGFKQRLRALKKQLL